MTWLTSLSLSFRGHWSRLTDGSRQKKKKKTNANRLSKESNTLTARRCCRRQGKEKRKGEEKKTKLTPRRTYTSAFIMFVLFDRETNKWPVHSVFMFRYTSVAMRKRRKKKKRNENYQSLILRKLLLSFFFFQIEIDLSLFIEELFYYLK